MLRHTLRHGDFENKINKHVLVTPCSYAFEILGEADGKVTFRQ